MTSTLFRTVGLSLLLSQLAFAQAGEAAAPRSSEILRPTNNSTAPRNTKLWFETFDRTAVLTLATAGGVAVPLERTVIALNAQFGGAVVVFKPATMLEANTVYVVSNPNSTFEAGRFTTTSEIDTTPPAKLAVAVMGAVGGVAQQSTSRISLSLGAQPEFAVIGEEGQTWQPTIALNTSTTSTADLFSMPEGEKRLLVFNVDLAGNATPSEVVTATVPPPTRGCSVAPAFPLALLGLVLLRRRTR
jgi:hypothetical protein